MRLAPSLLAIVFAAAAPGCAPKAAPPATPTAPPAPTAPPSEAPGFNTSNQPSPFSLPTNLREEQIGPEPVTAVAALGARPKGVPAAPKSCSTKPTAAAKPACETPETAAAALADALDAPDAKKRDAMLATLEACALPPGLVRALRADLGPTECADVLLEPYLSGGKTNEVSVELKGAMTGLVYAAWASRAVTAVPTLPPPHTKAKVLEHVKGPGLRWVQTQAGALDEITKNAIKLPLYGRAIAASEVGSGYLRFVEGMRTLPAPDEFKQDKELADAYYGSLDQLVEPQKAAGRDAALVGLRDFAVIGAIEDDRVIRARRLVASVFGGRKIDALDSLALPSASDKAPTTVPGRLARKLPTFFAGLLLPAPGSAAEVDREVLDGFAKRGIPMQHRKAHQERAKVDGLPGLTLARARFAMGQRYWRTVDFDQTLRLLGQVKEPPEHTLLFGLASALRQAPDGAGAVVIKGFDAPFETAALEAVAKENGGNAVGGAALFDLARLKEIEPPHADGAKHYRTIAALYRDAAKLDPALAAEATKRAENAELIAKDLGPAK